MRKLLSLCITAVLFLPSGLFAGDNDLAVVVNKANSAGNLTKSQLRKLVLGEQGSWPGGAKVTVVLRNPGSPERTGVLKVVCRMSEDDYTQHSMHSDFTGEATSPPRILSSNAAVRQFIASSPGAIGFLPLKEVNDSVKVVSVDGVAAGEAEYKIKVGQ
jgi:phosphate transport system substrate-binding protein